MTFFIIKRLLVCAVFGGSLIGILAGCSTPQCRARKQAAFFHKISPSEQKFVLRGSIHRGMSREAVYIAWGRPDQKFIGSKGLENVERWIFLSQITHYAPMGDYNQRYPGAANLYAPNFSLWSRPGFAYGGAGDVGFLYPSRVILTETRYKKVEFVDGKVQSFEVRRGGTSLLPLP